MNTPGDNSYWCVCVGWAYEDYNLKNNICPSSCTDHQYYIGDDDPEDEGVPPHHFASALGKAGGIPGERCMIYIETIRDRGVTNIAKTVSHEVGHCLDLWHSEYNPATGTKIQDNQQIHAKAVIFRKYFVFFKKNGKNNQHLPAQRRHIYKNL